VTGIVPTNTYRCKNGKYVVIGGNGDSIFQRLMTIAGHPEMASDSRMANNAGRVKHEQEIDNALASWCMSKDSEEILKLLEEARVPGGPIYNVEDMFADPHFNERGLFEQVEIDGKPLKIPAILPRLSATPGRTEWPGDAVGSHTLEVLETVLNLSKNQISELKQSGVI